MKLPYAKLALSIANQIAKLQNEGMVIADVALATHCLQHISYYRLSAYWLAFELPKGNAGPRFKAGTSFENVMALCEFDRKLRLLVLDAIERVEVAVRGSWAYQLAMLGDGHSYLDVVHYADQATFQKNHDKLEEEVKWSKDTFIVHYKAEYSGPKMPPVWMTAEILTFGQLSKWYRSLKLPKLRQLIADPFDLDEAIFVSLLHPLSVIRNFCAHHSRLWNRSLNVTFTLPKNRPVDLATALNRAELKKIYNSLAMLQYLLAKCEPPNNWAHRLTALIDTLPAGREAEIGFPTRWKDLKLWGGTQ